MKTKSLLILGRYNDLLTKICIDNMSKNLQSEMMQKR